ncbi:MAG TPA: nuclear transport factor 2 family protein [Candidatus Binatia bacterium]|nr:nuclear transport factor 2 family protein [Candidatus Binatia bacterium]
MTGVTYNDEGAVEMWRSLLRLRDLTLRQEPLATLGDSLALYRASVAASGGADGDFDVGAVEGNRLVVLEANARGTGRRSELFALERLRDAVVRLYERWIDHVPEGPGRVRAAATARALAVLLETPSIDRYRAALAPGLTFVDHRRLVGFSSRRGAEQVLDSLRTLLDMSTDLGTRVDEVLAVDPNGLLIRWTEFGTARAGGGAYERVFLRLLLFGPDGLATRFEMFDAGDEQNAFAHFDALTTAVVEKPQRRVRQNAATANAARLDNAIAARDTDALPALLAERYEYVDHVIGRTFDRRETLASMRHLLRAADLTYGHEPLASLGDSLALFRLSMSASGVAGGDFDVGPYAMEQIILDEADAEERGRVVERFPPDRLGDAVVRLYERYADLLHGPERIRAAATARAAAACPGPVSAGRYAAACAADVVFADRRTIGFGCLRGIEAIMRGRQTLVDASPDSTTRLDDVLDLRSDGFLVRVTNFGTDRTTGGSYERLFLQLWVFGSDGLVRRIEIFDPERDDDALARFDELTTATPPSRRRRVGTNVTTAAVARLDAAVGARDVDALRAIAAAEQVETIDHTAGLTYDAAGNLASRLMMLSAKELQFGHEPLAILGDSLGLFRLSIEASGFAGGKFDVGAYERDILILTEVDAHGRSRRSEIFAGDQLAAAVLRLYEVYAEILPGGTARARAVATVRALPTFGARGPADLDRIAATFTATVAFVDHRRVGVGSVHGAEAVRRTLGALVDLTTDTTSRLDDVLGVRPDALLARWTHSGTDRATGGTFERWLCSLWLFGDDGLLARVEHWDAECEDEALARFDELTGAVQDIAASPARDPLAALARPNAATGAMDRVQSAFEARDWAAMRALCAADAKMEDRRRHVLACGDADWWIARAREDARRGVRFGERRLVATVGERVAVEQVRWTGETGFLHLVEVGEDGRIAADIRFDVDAQRAAFREARLRSAAADRVSGAIDRPISDMIEGLLDRDGARIRAMLADDIVVHDHRRTGIGSVEGAAAYGEVMLDLLALVPDMRIDATFELARAPYGAVTVGRTVGTFPEGGPFEIDILSVYIVERGRITHWEIFEIEDVDAALARFAALRPDPLRIPPSAATRAKDRFRRTFEARDWAALETLCAPTMVFDDRRRGIRLAGDRDMCIASARFVAAAQTRMDGTLLATAGDRLCLEQIRWTGAGGGGVFEAENLSLTEVDADGRIVAVVSFDPDDRRAASEEMFTRFGQTPAGRWARALSELRRGVMEHDLARVRAALPDDFVYDDHRRARGPGRVGPDEYVAWLTPLFEQSPDAFFESMYQLATGGHGTLDVAHTIGTLADGGPFESIWVMVTVFRDERIVRVEVFEPEDLEIARARFEELRPDPTRIAENTLTRALRSMADAFTARDWQAVRAFTSPAFRFDDRRRRALVSGDVELWLQNLDIVRSYSGLRTTQKLIATAGERIALVHVTHTGEVDGGPFEGEFLRVSEIDAEGRLVASIHFDLDDRGAAFDEAEARFLAGEAAPIGGQAPIGAMLRAFNQRRWEILAGCLARDAVIHDRRAVSVLGTLAGPEWVDSLRTLTDLAPDAAGEVRCILAWNRHGRVDVCRQFGRRDGGPFETVLVRVIVTDGERIERYEMFDAGAADEALARFAALCAQRDAMDPEQAAP